MGEGHAVVRPSGTVTFLFTDVEGSTRWWAADQTGMSASLGVHDAIARDAVNAWGGYVFATGGDGFGVAFSRPSDAVAAAERLQADLSKADWPGPVLRVRMGLHLGEAEERNGDYFGLAVNTAARVAAAAHGGQVLLTDAVRSIAGVPARDLGAHRLRDVEEPVRLYQLGEKEFPPLRVLDPRVSNLPVLPTRLIGREDDLDALRRLLAEERWVTVTAVGGCGKTRLAIAVAEAELHDRPDGVWFVDLRAVVRDDEVPGAVAKALGLTLRAGDAVEQVLAYLHDKTTLVVLDNCEHVVDGCAEFAERFLSGPSRAVVLATSREALSVEGERTVALARLHSDGVDAPAVRLFMERAAVVDPTFTMTEADRGAITAVCTHLDGLPLAIELAAARVSVLTPAELLAGLSDRFAMLSGGRKARRTLEAALDWSYQLLGADEQHVLRALGVFVDGFDLDAVAAVADVSRPAATIAVEALLAKSLLVRVAGGQRARFGLLESVKAYAERLLVDADEMAETRDRMLGHFHSLATQRGASGFSELRLGISLRADRGNLTATFEWAVEQHRWTDAGEVIAGSYAAFLLDGGGLEAAALIKRATEACERNNPGLADALRIALSHCLVWLNEWSTIGAIASALTSSAVPAPRAFGLILEALVTGFSDRQTAEQQLERARLEVEAVVAADPSLAADIIAGYVPWIGARIAANAGDYETALQGTQAWLDVQRDTDFYSTGATRATKHIAVCQILTGRPTDALRTIEWVEQFDFVGSNTDDVRALSHLALGDRSQAEHDIRVQASRALTGRLTGEVCDSALLLAALAHAEGSDDIARRLLLEMGMGQEPATIVYTAYLASQLGVTDRHADRQRLAIGYQTTSPEGPSGSRMAMTAVRRELRRRGWLPADPS